MSFGNIISWENIKSYNKICYQTSLFYLMKISSHHRQISSQIVTNRIISHNHNRDYVITITALATAVQKPQPQPRFSEPSQSILHLVCFTFLISEG